MEKPFFVYTKAHQNKKKGPKGPNLQKVAAKNKSK